jgi:hypothetical protein
LDGLALFLEGKGRHWDSVLASVAAYVGGDARLDWLIGAAKTKVKLKLLLMCRLVREWALAVDLQEGSDGIAAEV